MEDRMGQLASSWSGCCFLRYSIFCERRLPRMRAFLRQETMACCLFFSLAGSSSFVYFAAAAVFFSFSFPASLSLFASFSLGFAGESLGLAAYFCLAGDYLGLGCGLAFSFSYWDSSNQFSSSQLGGLMLQLFALSLGALGIFSSFCSSDSSSCSSSSLGGLILMLFSLAFVGLSFFSIIAILEGCCFSSGSLNSSNSLIQSCILDSPFFLLLLDHKETTGVAVRLMPVSFGLPSTRFLSLSPLSSLWTGVEALILKEWFFEVLKEGFGVSFSLRSLLAGQPLKESSVQCRLSLGRLLRRFGFVVSSFKLLMICSHCCRYSKVFSSSSSAGIYLLEALMLTVYWVCETGAWQELDSLGGGCLRERYFWQSSL